MDSNFCVFFCHLIEKHFCYRLRTSLMLTWTTISSAQSATNSALFRASALHVDVSFARRALHISHPVRCVLRSQSTRTTISSPLVSPTTFEWSVAIVSRRSIALIWKNIRRFATLVNANAVFRDVTLSPAKRMKLFTTWMLCTWIRFGPTLSDFLR